MRVFVTGVTGQVGGTLLKAPRTGRLGLPVGRKNLISRQPDRIASTLIASVQSHHQRAAYTAVDRAEDERETGCFVQCDGPCDIARWAADRSVPVIHFSTDMCSMARTRPGAKTMRQILCRLWREQARGEDAVRSAGGPHLIVRRRGYTLHIGTNFRRTIVRLAKERKELCIVADQVGAPTSAPLIADAVAGVCRHARYGVPC